LTGFSLHQVDASKWIGLTSSEAQLEKIFKGGCLLSTLNLSHSGLSPLPLLRNVARLLRRRTKQLLERLVMTTARTSTHVVADEGELDYSVLLR
jgi:hypothetical protein